MSAQPPLFRQNSTWRHYVGRYHKSTDAFVAEARAQGITRRVAAQAARGMHCGDRLVFLRWAGAGRVWAFAEGTTKGVVLAHELAMQVGEKLAASGRAAFVAGGQAVSRDCGSYLVTGTWQVDADIDEIAALAIRLAAPQGNASPFMMISVSLTRAYPSPVYLSPPPGFTPGFIRSNDASFTYEAPGERTTITAITGYRKRGEQRIAAFSLPSSTPRSSADARHWQCISDPTGEPDLAYRGDFYGGRFRFKDLQASQENDTWPEGIAFCNIITGERLAYCEGKLVAQ